MVRFLDIVDSTSRFNFRDERAAFDVVRLDPSFAVLASRHELQAGGFAEFILLVVIKHLLQLGIRFELALRYGELKHDRASG